MRTVKLSVLLCAALISLQTTALFGQSFSVLHDFSTNLDGQAPEGGLTMYGNTLYGVTESGDNGSGYDSGTIFSISTNGTAYSILYSFSGADGDFPTTVPVVSGGFIYGTTAQGGSNFDGVIYRLALSGSNSFNVLHTFNLYGKDGFSPVGNLLLTNGTLYGSCAWGGVNSNGTIYSIGDNGDSFTVIHSFGGADGINPSIGQLVLSSNTIYGAAWAGGSSNYGVIYSVCTNGSNFTVLHNFTSKEGATPVGNLVLCGNTLYGTTELGGSNNVGTVFSIGTNGSNYRQLYAFGPLPDGQEPVCNLTILSNTIYGTTSQGGSGNSGTIFSINTDGTGYQNLYSLSSYSADNGVYTNTDGMAPEGNLLVLGTNVYGVAPQGGPNGKGTLFELTVQAASNTAPNITVQPQNEAVIIGSNMTLTVTATGLPTPTYQWQLNGTNIALATDSSYTVTNAQLSCSGNYSVIVSNSAGSVTSSSGYLSVAAAPFFYSEASLGGGWCWLQDTTNHIFGYFNYSPNTFPFLFHIDLGEEFFFDAGNANSGAYFYDFGDGAFFYTEPGLFPYLYDFHLNNWVWYEPAFDTVGYGRYTSNPRWFFDFTTTNWINHL